MKRRCAMSREIDYQKAFKSLADAVDRSVNFREYDELKCRAWSLMAYRYKQCIEYYAEGSDYFNWCLERFNEWHHYDGDDYLYQFGNYFYCPWIEDEFVSQTEPDEDGNYTMTWKETSYTGREYQTKHNLLV